MSSCRLLQLGNRSTRLLNRLTPPRGVVVTSTTSSTFNFKVNSSSTSFKSCGSSPMMLTTNSVGCSNHISFNRSYSTDSNNEIDIKNFITIDTRVTANPLKEDALRSLMSDHLNSSSKFHKIPHTGRFGGSRYFYRIEFSTSKDAIEYYNIIKNDKESSKKYKLTITSKSLDPLHSIGSAELNALPRGEISNVEVVENEDDAIKAIIKLLGNKSPLDVTKQDNIILGLDCEWPALRKFLTKEDPKISLIQISNGEYTVLFRICKMGMIKALDLVLKSKEIKKVGHGVEKDANRLNKEYSVLMNNIYDFAYHPVTLRCQPHTLSSMVGIFKNVNITRKPSIIKSNWATSQDLSPAQIEAAASSAYYQRQLYILLESLPYDIDLSKK